MDGFLRQLAEKLYAIYGDDISSLNILLPNRRAKLFFSEALSEIAQKPLWQPKFLSVDELMQSISGLRVSDPIPLIAELYKVYSRFHKEEFDTFYFWGEMLLSDFDSVDKYLIDARMLFANIADLKLLESDLSFLTDEQISVIQHFWESFSVQSGLSREQAEFLRIWESLGQIYTEFRASLQTKSMAYTGMMYREAVEKIKSGEQERSQDENPRYVIAGFNALSECEKCLFDYLEKNFETLFFWDFDDYYLLNKHQEAGLFMRENVRRYAQKITLGDTANLVKDKNITVVSAPSDSLQCRYVNTFLSDLNAKGHALDKRTAVVLTDENLLLPVVYSMPSCAENINITMGYPLSQTIAYSFCERLLELQKHIRQAGGSAVFYYNDVLGLLSHPYVVQSCACEAEDLSADIIKRGNAYVSDKKLQVNDLLSVIFRPVDNWQALSDYLVEILSRVSESKTGDDTAGENIEFFSLIIENIYKVTNSVKACELDVSLTIYVSLLRRILQRLRVPYQGEPLLGVQVMGILETRNLDFDNVLVLSMNDENFPGNHLSSSSFIPFNLRMAYGLPTPSHHEGVYAYYFYRLLQRAKNVHLVYSSRSDEKQTGEQSRYIYQLIYESTHKIETKTLEIDVNLNANSEIQVPKGDHVMELLSAYFDGEHPRVISPTAFYAYVECPLKFYFRYVALLKKDDTLSEQVDSPMFGTILHKAMELLYSDFVGEGDAARRIKKLINSSEVERCVAKAINQEYLKDEKASKEDYGGNLLLVNDIVVRYINQCILPFDSSQGDFTLKELERKVRSAFNVNFNGRERNVYVGGLVDRLDLLGDGTLRVVDYKTGGVHKKFECLEDLFSDSSASRSSAVLQTLIYAMVLNKTLKQDVQPALYYMRMMNTKDYSPLLEDTGRGAQVRSYLDYKDDFEQLVKATLEKLFCVDEPFVQCADAKVCAWCDYKAICRR